MRYFTHLLVVVLLSGCLAPPPAVRVQKPPAQVEDEISVYFSPHGGAMAAILKTIGESKSSIDVQAYLITSHEIVDALKAAHSRGVVVRIVIDKNNIGGVYSYEAFFANSGIPIWRDGEHKDLHDKVMLIDGKTIITGSFNFTQQSEDTNSENLLIIRDKPKLFAAYEEHFQIHLHHSDPPPTTGPVGVGKE